MKYTKLIILLLFISCKITTKQDADVVQEKKEIQSVNVEGNNHNDTEEDTSESIENVKKLEFDIKEVLNEDMIGLSLDEEEKEVLKKYTYDVSGACYSCDIANVKFSNKEVILTNICEDSKEKKFEVESIVKKGKTYEILFIQENKRIKLFITKVEEVPIYNFELDANFQEIEDFKINKFYITKKELEKLEIHDCGDFEG
ncbi:hypothetical protein SAMN05444344_2651 [Tenacibaculum mesophilum]|uniref:NlpE N-terminal domain-containing protein n=1 Tax=Tenacibaculum mesophilum TaxID=104268 RepID=A0ABN5T7Y5_9FLAO|nr:hypothetical protein [Tenacibaculum mesophilum]AZJ32550.1 hypothetical protein D6200_08300 [Tenacibaculum mesophilum]QFS27801.1 hypothetical protein F9Y86_05140 [Tenacibaculum mesophilum]SHG08412.1 hypothetical protein SAMN05444344_2651 [Tenacibaculum mesophilum]